MNYLGEAGPAYNVNVGIEDTLKPGMYTDTDEVTGNVDRITSGPEYSSSVYDWSAALHPKQTTSSGKGIDLIGTIQGMLSPKSKKPGTPEAKSTSTALIIGGMAVAGVLAVIILSKG